MSTLNAAPPLSNPSPPHPHSPASRRANAELEDSLVVQPKIKALHTPLPLSAQLPRGRLIELQDGPGKAPLTTAVSCLRYAQQQGETSAWVQLERGPLYPPDLSESGIDLASLIVIQAPHAQKSSGILKAAEILLRSGGFGIVVIDLLQVPPPRGTAWQGRLLGMAREHASWVVLLGQAQRAGTLGPLISLCVESKATRLGKGLFSLQHQLRKDKSALLGPVIDEQRRGPWGLL